MLCHIRGIQNLRLLGRLYRENNRTLDEDFCLTRADVYRPVRDSVVSVSDTMSKKHMRFKHSSTRK